MKPCSALVDYAITGCVILVKLSKNLMLLCSLFNVLPPFCTYATIVTVCYNFIQFLGENSRLLKTECQRWQGGPYTLQATGMLEIRPTCWKLKPCYPKAERRLAREDSPTNNETSSYSDITSIVAYYNRSTKQTAALWLRLTSENEQQIAAHPEEWRCWR